MVNLRFQQAASFSAAIPNDLQAEAGESARSVPVLEADLYEGGMLSIPGISTAVVVDLEGFELTAKPRPMLFQDDSSHVIGHTELVQVDGGILRVVAVLSGTGERAREVKASAANGFPWQVSFFVEAISGERVPLAASVDVNGRTFDGPVMVYRESRLKYVSIQSTDMGDATAAKIHPRERNPGFNATLHDLVLQAEADAAEEAGDDADVDGEEHDEEEDGIDEDEDADTATDDGEESDDDESDDDDDEEAESLEGDRCAEIREMFDGWNTDMVVEAIEAGWSVDEAATRLNAWVKATYPWLQVRRQG